MPAALMPKDEVVDRLLPVFRRHGYGGASIKLLSEATGLGRSSLYHHFPGGKEDMARAVLERLDAWLVGHAVRALEGAGTPAERLEAMCRGLDGFYRGGREGCVWANLVLGGSRALFQEHLKATIGRLLEAIARVLVEAGLPAAAAAERAQDGVLRVHGALVLAGGLDDPAPFARTLRRLPAELLAPP